MKKFMGWLRANAGVIIAATTISAIAVPGSKEVSDAIRAAVTTLSTDGEGG